MSNSKEVAQALRVLGADIRHEGWAWEGRSIQSTLEDLAECLESEVPFNLQDWLEINDLEEV